MKNIKKLLEEFIKKGLDEALSSGDVDIIVNYTDFEKLKGLFDSHGIDISPLIGKEEAVLAEVKNETFDFDGDVKKITIPYSKVKRFEQDIFTLIEEMGTDINKIQNWYINAHEFIVSNMGEDAALFLCLLAVTSKSRGVGQNFSIAASTYLKLKADILNNKEMVLKFITDPNVGFGVKSQVDDLDKEYKDNLSSVQLSKEVMGLFRDFKNIGKIVKEYITNGEKLSIDDAINWLTSNFNPETTLSRGKTLNDAAVSGHKIFNYTLNLLDPYHKKFPNYNFIVIDRHMIRYLVPEAGKLEGKQFDTMMMKVFSDSKQLYYRLSKLVQTITDSVNKTGLKLNPSQVQAIIWYIARSKFDSSNNTGSTTYEEEFHRIMTDFNVLEKDTEDTTKVFMKTINYINANFKQVLGKSKTPYKPDEEVPF